MSSRERRKSAVFEYFKLVPGSPSRGLPENRRTRQYSCCFCQWQTVVNATRMTIHLTTRCPSCPMNIRQEVAGGEDLCLSLVKVKKERKHWKRISPLSSMRKDSNSNDRSKEEIIQKLVIHREDSIDDESNGIEEVLTESYEIADAEDMDNEFDTYSLDSCDIESQENKKPARTKEIKTENEEQLTNVTDSIQDQIHELNNSSSADNSFFNALQSMVAELKPHLKLQLKRKLFNLTADYVERHLEEEGQC